MGYATPWNPSTARNPKTSGRVLAEGRQDLSVGGCNAERLDKLRGAMGPGLSKRRDGRAAIQTSAGPPPASVRVSETQAAAVTGARHRRGGICDAALELAANCQTDREALRHSLSPRPCVAGDAGPELDVAEAGAPRHPERRGSHRALEEASVAPDKKKPEDLGPISYSSTKAASSSSLTSARHGRRSARPRSSGTAIGTIGSPPSPLSRSPHRASGWGFTFVSTPSTSRGWRSSDSCDTFCVTCADRSWSSGTVALFTNESSSRSSLARTSDSTFIGSPHTPRRSTLMSSFGPKPRARWQMVAPRMLPSLADGSVPLCIASGTPSGCFGPAFTLRSCRGPDSNHIHYLCEYQ